MIIKTLIKQRPSHRIPPWQILIPWNVSDSANNCPECLFFPRPLLKMVMPINDVSLYYAEENILTEVTEVTDTVENIYNRTSWSINVAVWCLFITYYW